MAPKKAAASSKGNDSTAPAVRPLVYLDLISMVPVATPAEILAQAAAAACSPSVASPAAGAVTPALTNITAASSPPQQSHAADKSPASPPSQAPTAATAQNNVNNATQFGRLVFELATDLCPKTAENFRQLCNGATVGDKKTQRTVSYKNCRFLRVTKEGLQCGDVLQKDDGKGSESIYGPVFEDEILGAVPHVVGTLSMCNSGPNTNGSQFFISLATSPFLDQRHVSFGTLVEGQEVLQAAVKILQQSAVPGTGMIEKGRCTLLVGGCGTLERAA